MNLRPLRTASALALGLLIALAGSVAADTAPADGDVFEPGTQPEAYLDPFAPGEVRSIDVRIVLTCSGLAHLDAGQIVTAGIDSMVAPAGGAILGAGDGTVGPPPPDWPVDGAPCSPVGRTFSDGSPSVVILRAPITPGTGYRYTLQYHRSIEPFGNNDPGAVRLLTAVEFLLDVVVNTPPTLTLPTVAAEPTVQADTTGGWTADWAGLGATDAEDDPDPTAGCTPAAGSVLPLGTTSVTCGVIDRGGLPASATFDLTVVDTTPPTLVNVPGDQTLTTGDSTGATLAYTSPSATDVVDSSPVVGCLPADGSHLAPGTTTVTCTATDGSGNTARAAFDVTVVDATSPTLLNMPGDQTLTTGDSTGATLAYTPPSATDVVDPSPVVGCLPASGSHLAPGTTTVTCTATDASGNIASDTFDVTVTYVAPHTASAIWGGPFSGAGSTFMANRGRNIPVKVDLFVDGVERSTGDAHLTVTPCSGGSSVTLALTHSSGRWNAAVDTNALAGSCHTVAAWIDGLAAGSFRLELRNAEPTKNTGPKSTATSSPTPTVTSTPTPTATSTPTPKRADQTSATAPTKETPAKDHKPAKADKQKD